MEETIDFNACIEGWLPLLNCLFGQVEIDNFYSRMLLTQCFFAIVVSCCFSS